MGCISGLTPDVPIGWPHRMCLSDHWMCPRLWTHGEVRPPSPRLGLRRLAVLLHPLDDARFASSVETEWARRAADALVADFAGVDWRGERPDVMSEPVYEKLVAKRGLMFNHRGQLVAFSLSNY